MFHTSFFSHLKFILKVFHGFNEVLATHVLHAEELPEVDGIVRPPHVDADERYFRIVPIESSCCLIHFDNLLESKICFIVN